MTVSGTRIDVGVMVIDVDEEAEEDEAEEEDDEEEDEVKGSAKVGAKYGDANGVHSNDDDDVDDAPSPDSV